MPHLSAWYEESSPRLSVRIFDNFLQSSLGVPNDMCVHAATCDAGIVVEWDGSAYPCDFYIHSGWKLGNVLDTPLAELASGGARRAFIGQKAPGDLVLTPPDPLCYDTPATDSALGATAPGRPQGRPAARARSRGGGGWSLGEHVPFCHASCQTLNRPRQSMPCSGALWRSFNPFMSGDLHATCSDSSQPGS